MWEPLSPELAEAIMKDRRESARSVRIHRGHSARPRRNPLRRYLAFGLAALAASIHSEAAQSAVGKPSGRRRRAESV